MKRAAIYVRGSDSIRTDQIGKVFIALSQEMRQCLICEDVFNRRAAFEHSTVLCMPRISMGTGRK